MSEKLLIYTDGSSLGNPGPGGYGIVIKEGKKNIELNGGEADTTNNRMEMLGVIEALNWVKKNKKEKFQIDLFSDSSLVINSLNNNWKRKKNIDLWAKLDSAKKGLNVNFLWVKGHNEHPENERCDVLAKEAAFKIYKNPVKKTNKVVQMGISFFEENEEEKYQCGNCGEVNGILSFMPDSSMIRVNCPNCQKFIKFATVNEKNLKIAKKRVLISKEKLEKVISLKQKRGEIATNKIREQIKNWTNKEADSYLAS